jgi:hypothetical protein
VCGARPAGRAATRRIGRTFTEVSPLVGILVTARKDADVRIAIESLGQDWSEGRRRDRDGIRRTRTCQSVPLSVPLTVCPT